MDIRAAHLPAEFETHRSTIIAERDDVRVHAPTLTPADVDTVCIRLLEAREQLLAVPLARVIAASDNAARRLLDPQETARARALAGLTAISGFSPPMAAHLLDRAVQDWMKPALERLVRVELGGPAAVESFVDRAPGVRSRAVAPPLGLHVFSGNVPGVSVTSIMRALLVRSAVFGKSAAREPVLGPLFAHLLAEADPVVGACVATTYWPGGDTLNEAAVLEHADIVVHYGSADAIASLRSRIRPGTRFVEHGPRISFAIVGVDAAHTAVDADAAAADLASAVALFDQQGCVSPQVAFVIGSQENAMTFAARVARQLERTHARLPRGRLERAEAAAIRELRTRAEFDAIAGGHTRAWEGRDLAWTVICSPDAAFHGSCLNRTLLVHPATGIDEVIELARPFEPFLQTVGIAGFDDAQRLTIAARLAAIGVSRTTAIAAMPWPPVTWHHDGRGPLSELVRWVDLEDSTAQAGSDSRNTSST